MNYPRLTAYFSRTARCSAGWVVSSPLVATRFKNVFLVFADVDNPKTCSRVLALVTTSKSPEGCQLHAMNRSTSAARMRSHLSHSLHQPSAGATISIGRQYS